MTHLRGRMVISFGVGILTMCSFAGPAYAQLGGNPDDGISTWRVIASLLICLALAVAGAFALRARLGGASWPILSKPNSRRLRLEESLRVSPHVQLCIIACDDREMLIATSANGAHLITDLPTGPAR
jgi:hypothetical protein